MAAPNFLVDLFAHTMTALFILGMIGCLVVIPITAYRLFSVLFEKDAVDEQ
jgi:hypothetical protein